MANSIDETRIEQGIRMCKALDNLSRQMMVGTKLALVVDAGKDSRLRKKISGKVIYKNNSFFTLQTKNYCESYSFAELKLQEVIAV